MTDYENENRQRIELLYREVGKLNVKIQRIEAEMSFNEDSEVNYISRSDYRNDRISAQRQMDSVEDNINYLKRVFGELESRKQDKSVSFIEKLRMYFCKKPTEALND
jgi:hypothetical protein